MGQKVLWLFVVWSCFFLFKGQSVKAGCPIVMTPSRVVVKYGDPLTVNCSSTIDQVESLGWESNVKGTPATNAHHVLLNIEKVDEWELESECFFNFKNGSQCIEQLPIIIYKPPDSVSIVADKPMEELKEYTLQCIVSNVGPLYKMTVIWYKGDTKIEQQKLAYTAGPPPYNQTQSSFIKLTLDKHDHGRKIVCEAKFDFEEIGFNIPPVRSAPLDLQVLYRPIFEETKVEMIEVPPNGEIILNCTAQGNPMPNYFWQVPQASEQAVGHQPVLRLQGASTGTYNCTASNSQGFSTKQFILTDAPRSAPGTTAGILVAVFFVLISILGTTQC
uniref:Ig-like domain-containing protein n=1 Tax=Knipowitschia caucasica TaxID=637954 RepID=A0AAV2KDX9_KNICA